MSAELREEIVRLGPWHIDIEVRPGITTRAFLEAGTPTVAPDFQGMTFVDSGEGFRETFRKIYPRGLEGRSALDCACNCGAYLLWLKELGAGTCFGFDIRQHWIDQARFLADQRGADDASFEICDLYELPKRDLDPFDVTLFNGIFYHLPNPMTGLKIAADLTSELLVVNTAVRRGYPQGLLVASEESTTHALSGVYGLNWLPSGPRAVTEILHWLGFPATRCSWWSAVPDQQEPGLDRMQILAARRPDVLEHYDAAKGQRWREVMRNVVPPEATMLVVTEGAEGDEAELLRVHGRHARAFLGSDRGAPETASELIAELEREREAGANFLVVPEGHGRKWLGQFPELDRLLERRYGTAAREQSCVIFELSPASPPPHPRS